MKNNTDINGFEWDEHNLNKNWHNHSVYYTECEEVFFNKPLIVSNDDKHSEYESRFYCLGRTTMGRRLFVVYTIRNQKIRIISARDMNKKEKVIYESNS